MFYCLGVSLEVGLVSPASIERGTPEGRAVSPRLSRRLARARVLLPLLKSDAGRELDARASSAQGYDMITCESRDPRAMIL